MATATLSGHDQVRDGYVGGTGLAVGTWPAGSVEHMIIDPTMTHIAVITAA